MKRRGGPHFRGGGGSGRGHGSLAGASFSEKRRRLNVDGTQRCRGVFLSTNSNDKQAIREFMNLMQQCLSNDGHSSGTEEGHEQGEGRRSAADEVTDGLTSELQELRHQRSRFIPMKDLIKGVTYIQFTKEGDVPSVLIHGLMKYAATHRETISCRHVSRLVPVDVTTEPNLESFRRAIRELVAKTMPHSRAAERVSGAGKGEKSGETPAEQVEAPPCTNAKETPENVNIVQEGEKHESGKTEEEKKGEKPQTNGQGKQETVSRWVSTWSCQYTSRSFDTVKKQQILDLLTDEVGPSYKVNLKESEFSIIVECNPIFFGACIARDYGIYARYNLHRCCHPDEDAAQSGGNVTRPQAEKSPDKDAEGLSSSGDAGQSVVDGRPPSNSVTCENVKAADKSGKTPTQDEVGRNKSGDGDAGKQGNGVSQDG
ncbi:transmembrane protein [Cystoisospora suis]|uniref:Transmembrane protein n=1 Tax=Cystoisospora suis TaxID=483139 RepID=A0A2C6L6A2_9APIC|nr:transmembrane protein [Cystoisospora suis]